MEKSSDVKFHENAFSGSRAVLFGGEDGQTDRMTDLTKLIVAFSILRTCPASPPPKKSRAWQEVTELGESLDGPRQYFRVTLESNWQEKIKH